MGEKKPYCIALSPKTISTYLSGLDQVQASSLFSSIFINFMPAGSPSSASIYILSLRFWIFYRNPIKVKKKLCWAVLFMSIATGFAWTFLGSPQIAEVMWCLFILGLFVIKNSKRSSCHKDSFTKFDFDLKLHGLG